MTETEVLTPGQALERLRYGQWYATGADGKKDADAAYTIIHDTIEALRRELEDHKDRSKLALQEQYGKVEELRRENANLRASAGIVKYCILTDDERRIQEELTRLRSTLEQLSLEANRCGYKQLARVAREALSDD